MEEQMLPTSGGVSITTPPLHFLQFLEAHKIARQRFEADPSKCYQRHIRELWAELEPREPLPSLDDAIVRMITRQEAESIILKYEWLAADPRTKSPMGRGISACYGLFIDDELLGANCFGRMGGKIGDICGPEYSKQTVCLMRGACVPHAPKNAASFLTRHSCRQAFKDFGWQIFFAYSDTHNASEIGTVYQACTWYYLGEDLGRAAGSFHVNFESPDGTEILTSYKLNHEGGKQFMRSLGWSPEQGAMRPWLVHRGWKPVYDYNKKKWAWFEGPNRLQLKAKCRFPFKPYPKERIVSSDL